MRAAWIGAGVLLAAACPVGASDDFQLWGDVGVEAPIGKRFHFGARSEIRAIDDASRLGLYNWSVGGAFIASPQLVFALEFLQEFTRPRDGFTIENRPSLSATVGGTWRGVDLSTRSKFEARLFEDGVDRFRYRNRLQAILPLPLWKGGPRPFLGEELFVEGGRGFDQNRATAGLSIRTGRIVATAYYLLLSTRRERWTQSHVLGFNLTYTFGGGVMMPGDGGAMQMPGAR